MRASRYVILVVIVTATAGACRRSTPGPEPGGLKVETVGGTLRYTNRLINEPSPYLQQHAHNPVDWYPWGEEAFARAKREGKPIFLSVGYSTCHWCHVMEAESFSNSEIADYMNTHFVSIKVDREERPDLDRLYQNYVIGVSEGGWPMSLFLTPDLKPFCGVNYVPADDRDGEPGFRTVLQRVATLWDTRRDEALRAAAEGTAALESRSRTTSGGTNRIDARLLDETFADISRSFDASSRGFGGAPRFPRPVVFAFLQRFYARTGTRPALDMTLETLRGMADGGLHDHLGGGFHRYATDRFWRVPHFEKMLYDQAQLASAYVTAFQATHDPFFQAVARDILDYVRRDMGDPGGAFMSAEDADSKASASSAAASEGAFYVWTLDEIQHALGADAALFAYHYGIEPGGNVPAALDSLGELKGRNVLSVVHSIADTATRFKRSPDETAATLDRARQTLRALRASRPRPLRDDKVLAAWNGLMLSALARAGAVFDAPEYLDAARAQAAFIEAKMFDASDGTLKRRYRQGKADIDALLEDYAFVIQGLLDLYEASFDARLLSWAVRLQDTQDRLFLDGQDGGYFSTRADAEHVLARAKEEYDGAEPAANSVAAMNLIRLSQLTERAEWRARAEGVFTALSPRLSRSGVALPQLLAALDYAHSRPRQIVVAGARGAADTAAMLRLVHDRYIPNRILLLAEGGTAQRELQSTVPFVEGLAPLNGRATIYICENYVCRLPTADLTVAARLLDTSGRLAAGSRQ